MRGETVVNDGRARHLAQATVQTYIVHLLRDSLDFVSSKERKPVATALKDIYRASASGEKPPPITRR